MLDQRNGMSEHRPGWAMRYRQGRTIWPDCFARFLSIESLLSGWDSLVDLLPSSAFFIKKSAEVSSPTDN